MTVGTERLVLRGPAGRIEAVRDVPALAAGVAPRGTAVIAHPHPLFGGTMDNKVVQTVARAFLQCGWVAVRFNFRGVGVSDGVYDEGRGEQQDLLAVIEQCGSGGSLALAGFSFGSYVASQVASALVASRVVDHLVLVGLAAGRFDVSPLPQELADKTLVVHGELDDTVPLSAVMDWARPQSLPLTVVPGGGHFFHGQLTLLKSLVVRHLRGERAG